MYGLAVHSDMRIKSFRYKALKRLYETGDSKGIRVDLVAKCEEILHAIEQARNVSQIASFPGWRLHPLKGKRRGEWSVRLTLNFRLTFRVDGKEVSDIDIEDYHGK
jgi:toxin HigB-1